jgi:hypothetical protein
MVYATLLLKTDYSDGGNSLNGLTYMLRVMNRFTSR